MTRQKLRRTAVLGVATVVWGMFCATQFAAAQATQYFSDAAGNLTWDNGVTKDWSNVSGGTPTGVYNVVFTASATTMASSRARAARSTSAAPSIPTA